MKKYVNFKNFKTDVVDALQDVAKKYGVNIDTGNISYDNTSFKLQLLVERADVDVKKLQFMDNVRYMHGFTADDYLSKVEIDGHDFTIIGFKPGNKYDVIMERSDGKQYCYTSRSVLNALKRVA